MASVKKYTAKSVNAMLRHIDRANANPGNRDIDETRTPLNYVLSPDRGMSAYGYYKTRLSELYQYGRADVKTMAGWIVTAPRDLEATRHEDFFKATYNFLAERYGPTNVVKAVVHMDEVQPHLHFYFIPAAEDDNPRHPQAEKVCATKVLSRLELTDFHPAFEKYLGAHGVKAAVRTGITRAQGGNRRVWEMKKEREYQKERRLIF